MAIPSVCTLRLVTKMGHITPPPLMPRGMLFMCYSSSLSLILYNSINNVKSHVRGSFIVSLIENNYHFAVAHCPPPLTPAALYLYHHYMRKLLLRPSLLECQILICKILAKNKKHDHDQQ